ncbi:choice-of-anchor G family protein [Humibacter ginsenosidimutans]|uniref:Choice-of-anchor G family protein n=1 Tax=Humibacter ginsenosidimutans TaxID=2599293 RepID=A0A5B8M2G7_9MICO|nr:choice-of-anchor G family protein [Humibacter ginsenosidimutans]QDZ14978.1 choice-of-anchor G family protein [Humibacter ginsenosidimutans]
MNSGKYGNFGDGNFGDGGLAGSDLNGSSFGKPSGISRRTVMKGAAWSVPVLAVSAAVPAYAAVSPTQCSPAGTLFNAQSRGILLSGTVAGTDLDDVAKLEGVHATAFSTNTPPKDVQDTETSPLDVTALSAVQLNLTGVGTVLSDILSLVSGNQSVGTVNQYAYAHEDPTAHPTLGASGAVTDSGAIALTTSSQNVPEVADLKLKTILQQVTGNSAVTALLSSITDLDLQVGAAAGRASLSSLCLTPRPSELDRDYLIAYIRLLVTSQVVGDLLSGLTTAVPKLTISTDAVWGLLGQVPLLGPLLEALGEGVLHASLSFNMDLLTAAPIPNVPTSALQVDLAKGTLTIDVASLLGGAYTGEISPLLNEQNPNTRLFIDWELPADAATELVNNWVTAVTDVLYNVISIDITAGSVSGVLPTGLELTGTLGQFLNGTATVKFVLAGVPITLAADVLAGLLAGIGGLVTAEIAALFAPGGALASVLTALNGLLSSLFTVLQDVLVLTVNAQNAATGAIPDYFQHITPTGRYDVAALNIQLVGLLNVLSLNLARGSVGQNVAR